MRLAELYFAPKAIEGRGRIYEWLGVKLAKRAILWLGRRTSRDSTKPNNYFLWDSSSQGLRAYERQTRYNELMHLAGMVFPIFGLFQEASTMTMIVLWLVIAVNIHPFMLQRYNRIRIYRLLAIMGSRE